MRKKYGYAIVNSGDKVIATSLLILLGKNKRSIHDLVNPRHDELVGCDIL